MILSIFSSRTMPSYLTMLRCDRRGFALNLSYELGRSLRRELAPSTSLWNRPRGAAACMDPLAGSKPEPAPEMERVLAPRSLDEVRLTESDWEEGAGQRYMLARHSAWR